QQVPDNFWDHGSNCEQYLVWLSAQLEHKAMKDWYTVSGEDFHGNHGSGMLACFEGSACKAVMTVLEDRHPWVLWKFQSMPMGYWDQADNRKQYFEWFARTHKLLGTPNHHSSLAIALRWLYEG